MVSETGITFLIVLCVYFSLHCIQFLKLYFWDVQKQQEGASCPSQDTSCIPTDKFILRTAPWRSSAATVLRLRLYAACHRFQHCRHWAQYLCTWACLSWKRQGELAVKDKQCHTTAGHSHSRVCGAASLWVRDCCWVAVKAEDYCGLYQLSMFRLLYIYLKKKSQSSPSN